jgi:hypothetical protein
MESWVILLGIVVCSLAFMMWLAMFALSRGMNSNLETDAESRRIASRQLLFGALLLACTIGLSVYFYGMDRDEIIPEIGPGLTTEAPMVKEELEKKSGAKTEAPKAAAPAPPAPTSAETPSGGEAEGEKTLPNPAMT